MKIGILTFHYAHNYGAVLQAYSLKKVLELNGYSVEIINYHNKKVEEPYSFNRVRYPLPQLFDIESLKEVIPYNLEIMRGDSLWKSRCIKFNNWIRKYLETSDTIIDSSNEIVKLNKDVLICGSDQIWNPYITNGFDPVYFLNFNSEALKISYGASMGVEEFEKKWVRMFYACIDGIDFISVREQTLKTMINKKIDKDVEIVMDPVFLLDRGYFSRLAKKPKLPRYVLVYTMMENPKLKKIAKKIAKEKECLCLELKNSYNIFQWDVKQIANADPNEFIGLISDAECVLTNSFHGIAFSIIFNKEFYCLPAEKTNSRILELLKNFHLEKRMLYHNTPSKEHINYRIVNQKIISMRKESINILQKMLDQ